MHVEEVPVVIAGAGVVGLTLAIDLTLKGVPVVVLEKGQGVASGSRSICQAQRTLEIWDRLGVGEEIRERGVTWRTGRVFHKRRELFAFDLQPEPGYAMPAFVNLQQYHVEAILRRRLRELGVAVCDGHELFRATPDAGGVDLWVRTAAWDYQIWADWLVSCEGVRSSTRRSLKLDFEGAVFRDKFLICDIRTDQPQPAERWFWFEPPFHDGQTALLHRQADDVWRVDLQLGWDADPEAEAQPERAAARIAAMLGHDRFSIEWVSVYVFQCRSLERYRHGRVIFAGDSAHQVSPFGARGGNGGVQDADNLGWKLARVVQGLSPETLLDSYDVERRFAAEENIRHSTRATDFITPKSCASRTLRDEVLDLAADDAFARRLVNSGRLSRPANLSTSPLNTLDADLWDTGELAPGSPALDAPVRGAGRPGWFLQGIGGGFVVLVDPDPLRRVPLEVCCGDERIPVLALGRDLHDDLGWLRYRYDLQPGSTALFRPDQHLAGRWRAFDAAAIGAAFYRACARQSVPAPV